MESVSVYEYKVFVSFQISEGKVRKHDSAHHLPYSDAPANSCEHLQRKHHIETWSFYWIRASVTLRSVMPESKACLWELSRLAFVRTSPTKAGDTLIHCNSLLAHLRNHNTNTRQWLSMAASRV